MKKLFAKILSLVMVALMSVSFSACGDFINQLDSTLEDLINQVEELVDGVNYIIDNFEDFKNPLSGEGELSNEWLGYDLDENFVQPEYVTEFVKGYFETNENGTVYTNMARISSINDLDVFVKAFMDNGYEFYNEKISESFYTNMLGLNDEKLCAAITKNGIYIQAAFFACEEGPNAVFSIANYDMLAVSEEVATPEETPSDSPIDKPDDTPEGAPITPPEDMPELN